MKEVIQQFLNEIGYQNNDYDEEQANRVANWLDIYEGKDKDHIFYIYNGKRKVKQNLKSLKMANQGCEDYSDFFFNEKLEITIDKEDVQNKINECLEQNNFLENANNLMQLVGALGTGAFVPYLDNDALKINYLNATNIIILRANRTEVIDFLGFTEEKVLDGFKYTLNAHIRQEDGTYTIYNREYKTSGKGGSLAEIDIDDELKEIPNQLIPKFAVIKTPRVNNLDINSPYGISLYANAIDNLIAIDKAYDTLDNEIWLGRKRVYVKGGATQFNTDSDGNITPIFDASEIAYYQLPGGDGDKMLTESSFDLRIEELTTALQNQLNIYCGKVGLEHNHYKVKDGEVYVNTTNLVSANSSTYRKIKKQENILTRAITELIYGIAELIGIKEQFSVSVFYDDSIIEDTNSVRQQAQTEYNTGIISKAQYVRDVYKLKDNEALEFINQMNKEIQEETITDGTEFDITE